MEGGVHGVQYAEGVWPYSGIGGVFLLVGSKLLAHPKVGFSKTVVMWVVGPHR